MTCIRRRWIALLFVAAVQRLSAQLAPASPEALIERATREGMPTRLLRAKIAEGAAKHAAPDRVLAILGLYMDALISARQLGLRDSTDWEAAASALRGGLSLSALRDMRDASANSHMAAAFMVAVDLVQRGIPADSVRLGLVKALRTGATERDVLDLQAHVANAMVNGTSALAAYQTWPGVRASVRP